MKPKRTLSALFDWPGSVEAGRCERCRRKMFLWSPTLAHLAPSEIDPDACEDCGEDILAACIAYQESQESSPTPL